MNIQQKVDTSSQMSCCKLRPYMQQPSSSLPCCKPLLQPPMQFSVGVALNIEKVLKHADHTLNTGPWSVRRWRTKTVYYGCKAQFSILFKQAHYSFKHLNKPSSCAVAYTEKLSHQCRASFRAQCSAML